MRISFELEDRCGFEAGDWNKRRYVKNGPVNFTDLSGLAPNEKLTEEADDNKEGPIRVSLAPGYPKVFHSKETQQRALLVAYSFQLSRAPEKDGVLAIHVQSRVRAVDGRKEDVRPPTLKDSNKLDYWVALPVKKGETAIGANQVSRAATAKAEQILKGAKVSLENENGAYVQKADTGVYNVVLGVFPNLSEGDLAVLMDAHYLDGAKLGGAELPLGKKDFAQPQAFAIGNKATAGGLDVATMPGNSAENKNLNLMKKAIAKYASPNGGAAVSGVFASWKYSMREPKMSTWSIHFSVPILGK